MDNKTLKALVVEYKEAGLTFQQIADKLADKYNVVRTRQALQGMYQRAVKVNESEEQKERLVATADIVNIYCLGHNMSDTKIIANKLGYKLSYNDVVVTIKQQKEYIKVVKDEMINKISYEIKEAKDINSLKNSIKYKDIMPTDKQIRVCVAEAYKGLIATEVSNLLAKAYQFTDDKSIVNKIIKDLNIRRDFLNIKDFL